MLTELGTLRVRACERAYACKGAYTLFIGQRGRERKIEGGKYRDLKREREREKASEYCIEGISETPNASADFYCQSNTNNLT